MMRNQKQKIKKVTSSKDGGPTNMRYCPDGKQLESKDHPKEEKKERNR